MRVKRPCAFFLCKQQLPAQVIQWELSVSHSDAFLVPGRLPGEAAQDTEGLQTMRTLARNMAFLVKSIALGREKYGLPEREEPLRTHFIR